MFISAREDVRLRPAAGHICRRYTKMLQMTPKLRKSFYILELMRQNYTKAPERESGQSSSAVKEK